MKFMNFLRHINRWPMVSDAHRPVSDVHLFDLITEYVNDWDEVLVFQCQHNSYISGIDSYHNNHAEDRRFKFYCCETVGKLLRPNSVSC